MSVSLREKQSQKMKEGMMEILQFAGAFKQGIFPSHIYFLFHNNTSKGNINRQNLH